MAASRTGGVMVAGVKAASPAWRAGVRAGDRIVALGRTPVGHELDFAFFAARPLRSATVVRRGSARRLPLRSEGDEALGISLRPSPVRRCRNHCVFCFVDQLPRGLRRSLYVKDEDVRHSFLHGNFVTLADLAADDLARVARMRLSPLYVSVHATDTRVRNAMLGRDGAPAILPQLVSLARKGIRFHTQVVVCPGWNDGPVLDRTIRDLLRLRRALLSIGVVPVGLTRHRRRPLTPVTPEIARRVCAQGDAIGDARRARGQARKVYLADEFYLRAGQPIPRSAYYEGFPQAENGIGLVRSLLDEWRGAWASRRRTAHSGKGRRLVLVTSTAAAPSVRLIARDIEHVTGPGSSAVVPVANRFLGESVTVAGLLTARDVVSALKRRGVAADETVLVPSVMFNTRGYTLDGWSVARLRRAIGRPLHVVHSAAELAAIAVGRGRTKGGA